MCMTTRTFSLQVTWLLGNGGEDEHVGGDHDDERNDEHEEDGETGVERLLPGGRVRAVRHALHELLAERTAQHPEDVQLQNKNIVSQVSPF